jgi:hypothetical protein
MMPEPMDYGRGEGLKYFRICQFEKSEGKQKSMVKRITISVKRITISAVVICLAMFCGRAMGQAQGGQPGQTDDQQAMIQQMRSVGQQIMQNMIQKGIDPQQFFMDIQQQMQDGTLDQSGVMQMMVDKGLIDQDSITQLQGNMTKLTALTIKQQLGATDDEWAVLQPRIQRVVAAMAASGQSIGQMRMAGFMGGAKVDPDVATATRELRAALKDPTSKPEDIAVKLQALRDARKNAGVELLAAQKDLVDILTTRQEATLCMLGLIG